MFLSREDLGGVEESLMRCSIGTSPPTGELGGIFDVYQDQQNPPKRESSALKKRRMLGGLESSWY